jgi:glycerophosphoryl diester phosphodiesterase
MKENRCGTRSLQDEGGDVTLNIAHRGARSLAPENTLQAARCALALGADLWETDVRVTADDHLVLMHDKTPARTTDINERYPEFAGRTMRQLDLACLRRLSAGAWFLQTDPFGQIAAQRVPPEWQSTYQHAKVPTLMEALRFTQEADWRVNLELKVLPPAHMPYPIISRLLEALDAAQIELARVAVSSFYHPWLRELRHRRPEIEVQALIGEPPVRPVDWKNPEFSVYNIERRLLDHERIALLQARGITVNTYTVNEEQDMRTLIASGIDGIITDYPQVLAALLKDHFDNDMKQ